MRDVFRIVHPELPDGGELFFREEEVVRLQRNPNQTAERQKSQSGNVGIVYQGDEHSIFTITMSMFFRDTVEKLDLMRVVQRQTQGQEEFLFYPFWLYDQSSRYSIIWTNVSEFFEQHARGRIEGNWEQVVIWEEVVAGVCVVTS